MTAPQPQAVDSVVVRACAVILNAGQVCLIRRQREGGEQYSLPGGMVRRDELTVDALARELKEELDLDVTALPAPPRLRWTQDQLTTRPGDHSLFRRYHLIYLLDLPDSARGDLAPTERDADDITQVCWVPADDAAGLHLYPGAMPALLALASVLAPSDLVELPPLTDRTFTWR
ncbi:NUDIX domain-containing protein [Streptacidiphilus sp. EB103A]|uniref:NUDIX domain-containing protein n=1 Tax=Streptacidiphilus sp. EB103A TaxID=3156275 RepID=UPI0035188FCE